MQNNTQLDRDLGSQLDALGEKLRRIRQGKSLNLVTVAEGCNLSTSLLSQVERGLVVPSLNTLYALCNYYGVSLFELFAEDRNDGAYELVRARERRRVSFAGSSNTYELISPAAVTSVSVLEMSVGQDATTDSHADLASPVEHSHEECVLVQEGRVEITLGDQSVVLDEGDAIYYHGSVPHKFRSVGEGDARVLLVTVPAV